MLTFIGVTMTLQQIQPKRFKEFADLDCRVKKLLSNVMLKGLFLSGALLRPNFSYPIS